MRNEIDYESYERQEIRNELEAILENQMIVPKSITKDFHELDFLANVCLYAIKYKDSSMELEKLAHSSVCLAEHNHDLAKSGIHYKENDEKINEYIKSSTEWYLKGAGECLALAIINSESASENKLSIKNQSPFAEKYNHCGPDLFYDYAEDCLFNAFIVDNLKKDVFVLMQDDFLSRTVDYFNSATEYLKLSKSTISKSRAKKTIFEIEDYLHKKMIFDALLKLRNPELRRLEEDCEKIIADIYWLSKNKSYNSDKDIEAFLPKDF